MREPWSSRMEGWHSHMVGRSLVKRGRSMMHWWEVSSLKSTRRRRRKLSSFVMSSRVVWRERSLSTGMVWRELVNWLMRWQVSFINWVMWRELPSFFRFNRWKLAVVRRKLNTVLWSVWKPRWKLSSLLRQAGRRKLAVIWWKLAPFGRSGKIWRWRPMWSIGDTTRRGSRWIELMEGRPCHIWRRNSRHIRRRHHIGRHWGSWEWRLNHHWRRYHWMGPWKHVGPGRRCKRRGLA